MKLCGTPDCRVCRAIKRVMVRPSRPGNKHHPLNTPAAIERADRIHEAMLALQAELGHAATLDRVAERVGLKSAGLVSLYMKRLEQFGRVRKVPLPDKTGRRKLMWEAVDDADEARSAA